MRISKCVTGVLILLLCLNVAVFGQSATGSLSGQVTDPSGAVVPGATIAVQGPGGEFTAVTNKQGNYEVKGLAAGQYTVSAQEKGFSPYTMPNVIVAAGQAQRLDIALGIDVKQEQITVQDEATSVDVNPSSNASSTVLKGQDLDALSDDPDELSEDLQALAGPSVGPNGGQIYIDGFSNGTLPPKSAIREVRINQNPLSAEYDKPGFGRIEVFTKPGTDKWHGQFMVNGNTSALNSKSPFIDSLPEYDSEQYSGNVSGALSKTTSLFFNVERRNINESAAINATYVDPTTFNDAVFNNGVITPRTRTTLSPRFDWQISPSNTLSARYQFVQDDQKNQGLSTYTLPDRGYNSHSSEHTLQLSDTQILSASVINETRFQYIRGFYTDVPVSTLPGIDVSGSFSSGGNSVGNVQDHSDRYELQNYTSMARGRHFIKFGGRLRASRQSDSSTAAYNGNFTFSALSGSVNSLENYRTTLQMLAQGYTMAQVAAAGYGPSQFSVTIGSPKASIAYVDAGLYAEDDWKMRPNLTLSYGLRFETQNNMADHADFGPRVGLSWGIGSSKSAPATVLRVGYGIFYDRFTQDYALTAERLNGVTQQQVIVKSPIDFYPNNPCPLTASSAAECGISGATVSPSIYRADPNLRSPYTMQGVVSVERQFGKKATASVTYLNSRGVHQFATLNVNAPLPGTYNVDDPSSGVRPLGGTNNIYQYTSNGDFKQNQLITNVNLRMSNKLTLMGFYAYGHVNSDTNGIWSNPSNSYDLSQDWGPSSWDVHHRVFVGGSMSLLYNIRVSPFVIFNSGVPYNLTTGQDLNGDSFFNDRPAYATAESTNLSHGYDILPTAGETIVPRNSLRGPSNYTVNLRVGKTIGFGPTTNREGGAPSMDGGGHPGGGRGPGGMGGPRGMGNIFGPGSTNHRYNLTVSASARNLFNHVNLGAPVSNLSSPNFGEYLSLAGGPFNSTSANRRLELQAVFSF